MTVHRSSQHMLCDRSTHRALCTRGKVAVIDIHRAAVAESPHPNETNATHATDSGAGQGRHFFIEAVTVREDNVPMHRYSEDVVVLFVCLSVCLFACSLELLLSVQVMGAVA